MIDALEAERKKDDNGYRAPRIHRVNRSQFILRPVDVEQLVPEDDEVRAIWELIGRMDLSQYHEKILSVEGVAGREAMDPHVLISLWVYAYKSGVSSAREVARLCEYHPGYQWITGMESINYHTLSDFRVKHKEALDQLFIELLGILSAEGLITLERVMHDGTKIRAQAGSDSFRREDRLKQHLALAREQVLAMEDPIQAQEVGPRVAAARKRAAQEKQQRVEQALVELEKIRATRPNEKEASDARCSYTDPESRIMKHSEGAYAASYNMQVSTDAHQGAIVGVGVSQAPTDAGELPEALNRVEINTGKKVKQAVVDGGFTTTGTILAMAETGVDLIGSVRRCKTSSLLNSLAARGIDPAFGPGSFQYDAALDQYICPANKILPFQKPHPRKGRTDYYYQADKKDCGSCGWKEKCSPRHPCRSIVRGALGPVVTAFREKMQSEESKAIYKQRGPVAEFPFAWIKEKMRLRQFRLRGLKKVETEALWACLTYNIQLWTRLIWKPSRALVPA